MDDIPVAVRVEHIVSPRRPPLAVGVILAVLQLVLLVGVLHGT